MTTVLQACLFDLDGVIIDTAKYHYQAWRELAEDLGFVFTPKDNERLKGVSRMQSLDILLDVGGLSFDDAAKEKMATRKNARYLQLVLQMKPDEILPGAQSFLSACRAAGIKTALASASKNAPAILAHMGMAADFDAVIDGNQVKRTKPDPEVFLLAAQAVAVPPSNCIVFEDAAAGIAAGNAAGMFTIGVGDRVILGAANLVISDLAELQLPHVQAIFSAATTGMKYQPRKER